MLEPVRERRTSRIEKPVALPNLELMYVECENCGSPVLWEDGRTTEVLSVAGIERGEVDASCLLLCEGCPECCPGQRSFETQVVRLTPQASEDICESLAYSGCVGHA